MTQYQRAFCKSLQKKVFRNTYKLFPYTFFLNKKNIYKKMSLKNPKTLRKCQENLQPQIPEQQFLKLCCTPENVCNFIFSTETSSKNMTFKRNPQVKIKFKSKVCQVFFDCDVIFDKLSKLGQISCVISYYIEIKDSLHLGKWASFSSIFLKIDTK